MKKAYSVSELPRIKGAKVAILQSKWHREYTDLMVAKCTEILLEAECDAPEYHVLPGSLELPIGAQTLLNRLGHNLEAIVCFGAIIKGDTYHFELVSQECVRGLGAISREFQIPIINEVLPCSTIEQLIQRSSDNEFNKGIEAALAAIEIIAWRRKARG